MAAASILSRRWRLSTPLAISLILWLTVSAGAAIALASAQRAGKRDIDVRFGRRADVASRFVATYAADILERERAQGRRFMRTRTVTTRDFRRLTGANGLTSALLLDADGRIMRTYPDKQGLLGTKPEILYDHLSSALAGRSTVSDVVPSVVTSAPIVGFAAAFDTPYGRRVFSGAQSIGFSAAGTYLRNSVTTADSRLYLLDGKGVVIASNGAAPDGVHLLTELEPHLASSLGRAQDGTFRRDGREQRYVSATIAGTPWRIAVAVPSAVLYRSTSGAVVWLPWLGLIGFTIASLVTIVLVARVVEARRRLVALNARLQETVRIDALTGLLNRRGLDEQLIRAASAAHRHDTPLTVMLLDVDHFKRLNDTYGHQTGDAVLVQLAEVICDVMRVEDVVGRWGGEEFLLMAPGAPADAAMVLGERLRARIAEHVFTGLDGQELRVTVSIGVQTSVIGAPEARVAAADKALYEAKAAGRDRVLAAKSRVLA